MSLHFQHSFVLHILDFLYVENKVSSLHPSETTAAMTNTPVCIYTMQRDYVHTFCVQRCKCVGISLFNIPIYISTFLFTPQMHEPLVPLDPGIHRTIKQSAFSSLHSTNKTNRDGVTELPVFL